MVLYFGEIMNFKITNNEDDSIKVEIEITVDSWDELKELMLTIENNFGV